MPLNSGHSQEAISENIAKLINEGYSKEQAAAIAYSKSRKDSKDNEAGTNFKIYDEKSESSQEHDINGFIEIKGNPISKVGVFPYSGAQIDSGLDANRIYQIYRPESELSDPETIESFKLLPFTVEHAMLGSEDEGMMAPEEKGVHGVIGEDVFFDDGYLKGNIKIFSEQVKQLLQDGMRELSIGYRCLYDMVAGVYNGQKYDGIQRSIRGNHLALVQEGRSGHDVAVLDSFKFTIDSKELIMADQDVEKKEEKAQDEGMSLEQCVAAIREMQKMLAGMAPQKMEDEYEGEKKDMPAESAEDVEPDDFVKKAEVEDKDEVEKEKESQDDGDLEKKDGDISKPADKKGMDEKSFLVMLSQKNSLAENLSKHIGTFDHSEKTHKEVALYGIKKLGLKCKPGHEISMLEGYLAASSKASQAVSFAKDSMQKSSCIDDYLKGVK